MNRVVTASEQIDQVSDGLTRMVEARILGTREVQALLLRLDRVANQLDQEEQNLSNAGSRPSVKFGQAVKNHPAFADLSEVDREALGRAAEEIEKKGDLSGDLGDYGFTSWDIAFEATHKLMDMVEKGEFSEYELPPGGYGFLHRVPISRSSKKKSAGRP
jgi:hypothetical protein